MLPYRRIPALANPGVLIRLASDDHEVRRADQLVFRNYVAEGYWDDDADVLARNKWLHSAQRDVFVAAYGDEIIGTVSIIRDSEAGLPSDSFQPQWTRYFRASGEQLAEVSALAVEKNHAVSKNLVFYLMKCYMQYSFYYTAVTRLVKACQPKHADFYADVLHFEKFGGIVYNSYARRPSRLLSMNLFEAHQLLSERYETDGANRHNFYRFLLVDEHPNVIFPDPISAYRPRQCDWLARTRRGQAAAPDRLPARRAQLRSDTAAVHA